MPIHFCFKILFALGNFTANCRSNWVVYIPFTRKVYILRNSIFSVISHCFQYKVNNVLLVAVFEVVADVPKGMKTFDINQNKCKFF